MPAPTLIAGDLYVRHQRSIPDAESPLYYGSAEVSEPSWVVCCRNPRAPAKTALPLGFASSADALRAIRALVAAGLGDTDAMHQRIKVDRDWAGVRRIMIEALAW